MDGTTIPVPQIIFKDISESDYLNSFSNNNADNNNIFGGALTDISVFEKDNYSNLFKRNNRAGAGIFSFLTTIAKRSYPYLKKYIIPEALHFGTSLIEKARNNPSKRVDRSDIKNLTKQSLKNIAKKALNSGGRGRKGKKKKSKRKPIINKSRVKQKKNLKKEKKGY